MAIYLSAVKVLRMLVAAEPHRLQAIPAAEALDTALAAWLQAQGLAPFTCHRLRELGVWAALSAEARDVLQCAYYRATADALLHDRELGRVLQALAGAGITPVLLKGAALAHTVYPTPACRPMGDLDLWVTADEMPTAQAALAQIGYRQRVKMARPVVLQAQQEGEIQMIGQAPGSGLVELHWGAFPGLWLKQTAQVDLLGLRSRLIPTAIVGQTVSTLAPEDNIIQVAVHMAINHQMSAPWMRGLLDVVRLAHATAIDWDAIVARATKWRVATATWLVLDLAVEMLGGVEAGPAVAALRPAWLRRKLIGRFCNAQTMGEMRPLSSGPSRLVYQLLMADRFQDAGGLFVRALWPDAGWLAARYGQTGWGMRWRHFWHAVRGRV